MLTSPMSPIMPFKGQCSETKLMKLYPTYICINAHIKLASTYFHRRATVGQCSYFTTSVIVLYELPLVAVLSITGNNF